MPVRNCFRSYTFPPNHRVDTLANEFDWPQYPHDFAKSKSSRRCDVSRNLRRARSDIELSPNDIEVRANDIEKAHSVDFRSHSVAKRTVVAARAESMAIGVTQEPGSRCGIQIGDWRSKKRTFGASKTRKIPEKLVFEPPQL